MKKIIFIIALLVMIISLFAAETGETYFKFKINSKKELLKLTRIISIDNVKGNTVYAYANNDEWQKFLSLGYNYTKLTNPGLTLKNPKMAYSKDQMRDWDYYPTYDTYVSMMYDFAEEYPAICSVQSIGQSQEGRELLVAKISDNVSVNEDEPEFFYTAQMHGDEIVTYITMLHLIDYLCSNYESDDTVTELVNNLQIYINPLSNPDGTYHGGNDTVSGAVRYLANGVDPNRNFPDPQYGDHPDGNDWAPETISMMEFASSHHFVMSANFHSGAEVVNYPWDTWQRLHADNDWYVFVSREYADTVHQNAPDGYMNFLDNGITNGYAWYPVNGGRQDYMNYFQHCREITIELSNVKMLPASQLLDHWNYNKNSLIKYMQQALYGITGHVTDQDGNPIEDAEITILEHDQDNSQVYTTSTFGTYYRPLKAGIYTVKISKNGYAPQIYQNVSVQDYSTTELDAVLYLPTNVTVHGIVKDSQTLEPIPNATITLLDSSIPPATTNQDGEYQIPNVPVGSYTFVVSAQGYNTFVQIENVTETSFEFNFNLTFSTAESFEGNTFPEHWSFEGNADWTIDSHEFYNGIHSAKSGDIDDGQTSSLLYTTTLNESGQISFYFKVSSENAYDFLKFYIDGQEMGSWSGDLDWANIAYDVEEGSHVFKWSYQKDTSVSEGEDCAWIDMVDMPSHGMPEMEVHPLEFNVNIPTDTVLTDSLFIANVGSSVLEYSITINQNKNRGQKNIEGSYLECAQSSFYTGAPQALDFTVHMSSNDGEWLKFIYIRFPQEIQIDQSSIGDFVVGDAGHTLPFVSVSGDNTVRWGDGNAYLENDDVANASLIFSSLYLYEDDIDLSYTLTGDNWGTGIHQIEDTIHLTNNGPVVSWFSLSNYSGTIAPGDTLINEISFFSSNLDIGTYSAELLITDNAGESITIPLHLTVSEASTNDDITTPEKLSLMNYPNPFNPETKISFNLNKKYIKNTKIEIFNLKGEKVKTIKNFIKNNDNSYYTIWNGKNDNGKNVGSGIYLYRLKSDKINISKKMILLK